MRIRRALVLAGCGMVGVGLSACESTEQESAKIGRENQVAAARAAAAQARPAHASSHHSSGRAHGARGGRGKSKGRAG